MKKLITMAVFMTALLAPFAQAEDITVSDLEQLPTHVLEERFVDVSLCAIKMDALQEYDLAKDFMRLLVMIELEVLQFRADREMSGDELNYFLENYEADAESCENFWFNYDW